MKDIISSEKVELEFQYKKAFMEFQGLIPAEVSKTYSLAKKICFLKERIDQLEAGDLYRDKINKFCPGMPIGVAVTHFSKFTKVKDEQTGEPLMTEKQLHQFIQRAFLGIPGIRKIKLNARPGMKTLIKAEFYDFYRTTCDYFGNKKCMFKYMKLLSENFVGFSYASVKNNFLPRSPLRLIVK